ncbi:hypothetical protein, partial [Treponema endosymbiont of Eucomonympha sp.]|uniref:hypothetical protein n=1 Tax=Treponema endosymbiont of Eucomonympha sp. TaxID=1580831 RepID=UPI001EE6C84D
MIQIIKRLIWRIKFSIQIIKRCAQRVKFFTQRIEWKILLVGRLILRAELLTLFAGQHCFLETGTAQEGEKAAGIR